MVAKKAYYWDEQIGWVAEKVGRTVVRRVEMRVEMRVAKKECCWAELICSVAKKAAPIRSAETIVMDCYLVGTMVSNTRSSRSLYPPVAHAEVLDVLERY